MLLPINAPATGHTSVANTQGWRSNRNAISCIHALEVNTGNAGSQIVNRGSEAKMAKPLFFQAVPVMGLLSGKDNAAFSVSGATVGARGRWGKGRLGIKINSMSPDLPLPVPDPGE